MNVKTEMMITLKFMKIPPVPPCKS